jgi:Tol biopolymer transport system component
MTPITKIMKYAPFHNQPWRVAMSAKKSIFRIFSFLLALALTFSAVSVMLVSASAPDQGAQAPNYVTAGNGKIAFMSDRDGNAEIYLMNADGTGQTRLTNNSATDTSPAWSPDGTKIAFDSNRDGNFEVYVMDADGGNQTRLTNNSAHDYDPTWSPDGTKIAFGSNRDDPGTGDCNYSGHCDIYAMNSDGSGVARLTTGLMDVEPAWSPDGTKIAFARAPGSVNPGGPHYVWTMNTDGSGQQQVSPSDSLIAFGPEWSPDGVKIAYSTGGYAIYYHEIYTVNADGSGGQTQLTNNSSINDMEPVWSPDGTKIAFNTDRDGNGEIYVMNANGSSPTRLTNNSAYDDLPDWQPLVYVISGNAGVAGATLSYTDGTAKTTTADGSGNYSFTVSYNWSGTVTPSKTGYAFTPDGKSYTNVLANQSAQDYTAAINVSGAWRSRADMPTARAGLGAAVASNGKIYAIGGGNNGGALDTVEEYDPATNTWTTRASMPTARASVGVAAASNGKIYAIGGGISASLSAIVEEYDPATNTWATRASMPTPRHSVGVVAASNGKIYAIGGDGGVGSCCLDTVEEYDPAMNTWATRASMPTGRVNIGVAAASNGKIYVIGGDGSGGNYLTTVEEYDPATNTWTTRASMPTNRDGVGAVTASNGRIYAIGGSNLGGYLTTVEEYDPATDTWTTRTSMLTQRHTFGAAVTSNGKIYAIGGWNGSSVLSVTEEFTPPDYFIISGNAGVAGATLSYTDGTAKTATADGSGNYSFTVSYNWSGTVTPSKTGYAFSADKSYSNVLANQSAQDYTATPITYTISGNAGIAGATLSYTDGSAKTTTADGSGNYSFAVSYNWSGTVTPSKTGYAFSPVSKSYTNVLANQTAQDYTAMPEMSLTLNTFIGGSGNDYAEAIATDGGGNVYMAGNSESTWGSPVRAYSGGISDASVTKLNSSGSVLWHTFLGGSGRDNVYALQVDSNGYIYVGGYSEAAWGSPVRAYTSGKEAFVAKLDSNGSLLWLTFLGGSGNDIGYSIAANSSGNVYVGGVSTATWGSPLTAYAGADDVFAAKLDANGSLVWSTFLGGVSSDHNSAIAVDGSGNVYLSGNSDPWSCSPTPCTVRAYTNSDTFAAKLNSSGSLVWNTFLGGSGGSEASASLAVSGSALFVGGNGNATWGSPVQAYSGAYDAFVAKIDLSTGALAWNTFLGGSGIDSAGYVAVDGSGNIYVGGFSDATWGSPVRAFSGGVTDVFAAKLDSTGNFLSHTFLGSSGSDGRGFIAADNSGNAYVGGDSNATWGSPARAYTSGNDAFVAYFITAPVVSFDLQSASDSGTSNTDNLTNASSPIFDAVFNGTVSGFTSGDLSNAGSATGCVFAVGSPAGNTYPVTVSSCSNGALILRMAASGVTDTTGNPIAQMDGPTVTIDRAAPTVTFDLQAGYDTGTSNTDNLTSVASLVFDTIFSKAVSGFASGDLSNVGTATGCSFTVGSPTGNTYPVTASSCSSGTLILRMAASGVVDTAGNLVAQTDGTTVTIDRTTQWQTTSFLITPREYAAVVTSNGHIYAIGGRSGSTRLSSVEFADINPDGTLGAWQATTQMNNVRGIFSAVATSDYIYAIGGDKGDGTVYKTVERSRINADGSLGAWENLASQMSSPRYAHTVVIANGYIYAIGGDNGVNVTLASVERAQILGDGTLGTWTYVSSMSGARAMLAAVVVGNNLYAMGGWDGSTLLASALRTTINPADGSLGTWTNLTDLNLAHESFGAAVSGQSIYIYGGDTRDFALNNAETATVQGDGQLSSWASAPPLITAKTGTGGASSNGYIYAVGGNNGQAGILNEVEVLPVGPFTISGNAGVAGATLSYTDGTVKTATADASGNYSFTVSYNWTGTVTPSKTGYTFTPASKPYTNVLANQTAQNYTATPITYTISGNAGIGGAILSYTDVIAKTATADGNGNYSFAVSYNWTGTVTPSKTGYTFTPASKPYANILADQTAQNYTATAITPTTFTISGNAGIAGATLSYTDGAAKTVTADGSGNYSFTVSYNWSGTVTPSMTGYTFTPASKTYANVLANQTAQDYTATAITYTISGNAGVAGVTLSYADGAAKTATADGSGDYLFTVSYNWSGTVTPSKTGYTFTPASKSYTNVLANQTAQNYTATLITYTISGNAGVGGATLSYTDGAAKTATADGSGDYLFTVSYNWSGTVTLSKTGYIFTPASKSYINVLANQTAQNYTATLITYTISGNAGVAGAALSYIDGATKTATADGSGNYSLLVPYNWSGVVVPSKIGYTFSTARSYTNVLADQTAQDYTATLIMYTISGNAGVAETTLSYTDGLAKTVTVDSHGNYSFTVSYNWSGTVTPSKPGHGFLPATRVYANVAADQLAQDYAIYAPAGAVADTTPTYTWNKVTGAAKYEYQVMKGTSTVYTKAVGSAACGSITCSNTPSTVLGLGTFKWRVRANVAGKWQAYSAFKSFTIKPKAGRWECVTGCKNRTDLVFYITPNQAGVDKFSVVFYSNSCGNKGFATTPHPLVPIKGNSFSFSGSFYVNNVTFVSPTRIKGSTGVTNYSFPGCPNQTLGPYTWEAAWKNVTQPLTEGSGMEENPLKLLSTGLGFDSTGLGFDSIPTIEPAP